MFTVGSIANSKRVLIVNKQKRCKVRILVKAQPAITWSKLTIETLEQGVKYVQS